MNKLLTINDVMTLLGVGRATATRIINQSGAALPRTKGQAYRIVEAKLMAYLNGGNQK